MMDKVLKIMGYVMCGLIASVVLSALYYFIFCLVVSTDVEKQLIRDIASLEEELPQTAFYADLLEDEVTFLQERDRDIYKRVFKADPPAISNVIEAMNRPGDINASRTIVTENFNRATQVMRKAVKLEEEWREVYDTLRRRRYRLSPSISPVNGLDPTRIGASIGMKMSPFYKVQVPHDGLDIIAPLSTPVLATAPGLVTLVRRSSGGKGNVVEITHDNGIKTRYAHLESISVRQGQYVRTRTRIGTIGDSGRSFTTHLHYEVEKDGTILDPCCFLYASMSPNDYFNILIMSLLSGQSQD